MKDWVLKILKMAPIALKDKRIEGLTKQLVKRFISGEVSSFC